MQFAGEVLVAGLGSIGERHVRNLLALGHTDISVLRRSIAPPRTLEPDAFTTITDVDQALERQPAALIIATPSAMHLPLLDRAVQLGIPTMVEVPFATTLEGLPQIADSAASSATPILIAHNLRFHPCLIAMHDMVARGDLGQALYSQAQFGEYIPGGHLWEDYRGRYEARKDLGGGAIFTSIHEIDHAVWLFGKVALVTARTRTLSLDVDVEDVAMMILEHRAGAVSLITLDFVQRPYRRWLQVVGSEGTAEWEFNSNKIMTSTGSTDGWRPTFESTAYDAGQSYLDELEHFARVARREEAPIVGIDHATHVTRVGIAAHESSLTGNRIHIND